MSDQQPHQSQVCPTCGKSFDPADLAQVAVHQHAGLPIDDCMGIRGQRVKPTRQKWYVTTAHWEGYAKQLESWLEYTRAKPRQDAGRPHPSETVKYGNQWNTDVELDRYAAMRKLADAYMGRDCKCPKTDLHHDDCPAVIVNRLAEGYLEHQKFIREVIKRNYDQTREPIVDCHKCGRPIHPRTIQCTLCAALTLEAKPQTNAGALETPEAELQRGLKIISDHGYYISAREIQADIARIKAQADAKEGSNG